MVSTKPRKTRSDKGIPKKPRAPKANAPSPFTITIHNDETLYSIGITDAIPLIRHGVSLPGYDFNKPFNTGDSSLSCYDVLDMLEKGWTTSRPALDLPLSYAQGDTFSQSMGCEGAYPDVATYLSGDPECMVAFAPAPKPSEFLHLVVNTTISYSASSEELFDRGRYLLSAIDSLESKGIRVKLTVEDSNTFSFRSTLSISVKDYQDPMDEALVTYVLGHPSFFRTCQFALADGALDKHGIRHGLAVKMKEGGRGGVADTKRTFDNDTLYLRWGTKESWEESVNSFLNSWATNPT
jgi:hypothetical protein